MVEIGGRSFVVPQPGGMRTFAFQQRILPIVGRVANVFIQLLGLEEFDLEKLVDEDVAKVLPLAMPHVGQIFSEMPAGELEVLARTLLGDPRTGSKPGEVATCDKLPLFGSQGGDSFDSLMQGRTLDTWKLLWHALGVWYPDFFGRVGESLVRAAAEKASRGSSTSPTSGQASDSSPSAG